MCVPCKLHPIGNEYYLVSWEIYGIILVIKFIEGKDRLKELGNMKYYEYRKIGRLLFQLYEAIFSTGKVIILDSGFYMLKRIISIINFGVYLSSLI